MKFRFIEDHQEEWPVRLICEVLDVSGLRLLRLAVPAGERESDRQPGASRGRAAPARSAPGPLRLAPDACGFAR